jgi:hypothetical protein
VLSQTTKDSFTNAKGSTTYLDPMAIMGNEWFSTPSLLYNFNAPHKLQLGWISGQVVARLTGRRSASLGFIPWHRSMSMLKTWAQAICRKCW